MIINDIDYGEEKVCAECEWSFFGPGRLCDECRSENSFAPKTEEDDPLNPPSRYHGPSNLSGVTITRVPDFNEIYADTKE
jgi:hypothetical protein